MWLISDWWGDRHFEYFEAKSNTTWGSDLLSLITSLPAKLHPAEFTSRAFQTQFKCSVVMSEAFQTAEKGMSDATRVYHHTCGGKSPTVWTTHANPYHKHPCISRRANGNTCHTFRLSACTTFHTSVIHSFRISAFLFLFFLNSCWNLCCPSK